MRWFSIARSFPIGVSHPQARDPHAPRAIASAPDRVARRARDINQVLTLVRLGLNWLGPRTTNTGRTNAKKASRVPTIVSLLMASLVGLQADTTIVFGLVER